MGQTEKIFSISPLTPSVKPLGQEFNFCTNRNEWFELNLGLDSWYKVGLIVLKKRSKMFMVFKKAQMKNPKKPQDHFMRGLCTVCGVGFYRLTVESPRLDLLDCRSSLTHPGGTSLSSSMSCIGPVSLLLEFAVSDGPPAFA